MAPQILQPGVTLRSTSGHKNCFSRHKFGLGSREVDREYVSLTFPARKKRSSRVPFITIHIPPPSGQPWKRGSWPTGDFRGTWAPGSCIKCAPTGSGNAGSVHRPDGRCGPALSSFRARAEGGRVVPHPIGWMEEGPQTPQRELL